VLVLGSTAFEMAELAAEVEDGVAYVASGRTCRRGVLYGRQILMVEGGLGAVNTAQALTCHLEAAVPQWVLQVGVGGAYPAAGLELGDWVLACEEVYGDIGVQTPAGWRGANEIGIPVLRAGGDYFNSFPLDEGWVAAARRALVQAGTVNVGTFVTVQECSGTAVLGAERQRLFNGICENMEGAAAAHICRLYGVPLIEVRAISNQVEDRRRQNWDLPLACRRAQAAARVLLHAVGTGAGEAAVQDCSVSEKSEQGKAGQDNTSSNEETR
jgi:futalosine hydrolase